MTTKVQLIFLVELERVLSNLGLTRELEFLKVD